MPRLGVNCVAPLPLPRPWPRPLATDLRPGAVVPNSCPAKSVPEGVADPPILSPLSSTPSYYEGFLRIDGASPKPRDARARARPPLVPLAP